MKLLGKSLIIICGFIIGVFFIYLLIGIFLKETKILSIIMTIIATLYIVGWLLAIFKNKQKLLLMTLTIFLTYIIAKGYLEVLLSEFSELTIIVVLIAFTYIGIFLVYQSKRKLTP